MNELSKQDVAVLMLVFVSAWLAFTSIIYLELMSPGQKLKRTMKFIIGNSNELSKTQTQGSLESGGSQTQGSLESGGSQTQGSLESGGSQTQGSSRTAGISRPYDWQTQGTSRPYQRPTITDRVLQQTQGTSPGKINLRNGSAANSVGIGRQDPPLNRAKAAIDVARAEREQAAEGCFPRGAHLSFSPPEEPNRFEEPVWSPF
jgi:hypothetical protein